MEALDRLNGKHRGAISTLSQHVQIATESHQNQCETFGKLHKGYLLDVMMQISPVQISALRNLYPKGSLQVCIERLVKETLNREADRFFAENGHTVRPRQLPDFITQRSQRFLSGD